MDVLGEMPKRDGADVFFLFPGVRSAVSFSVAISREITDKKLNRKVE